MMSENPQRTAFTSLDPEWAAYRDQLVAYARAGAEGLSPGDPRALVPESLRPGKHRVHSSYVWLGGLGAAMTVAVLMVVSMFGSVVGALAKAPSSLLVVPFVALGVMVLVVVVFAVVFLVQWLSWKHLSYELLPEEFNLYSGILNKKRRHVPYQRVQSVNQQAGVLQRILGVCDVKIDTAGGASNDAIMLKFVQTSEAEALRSEIFRRKKILLAGGAVDEFGNAFVSGMVVPSAWMMANAAGDERAVRIAFGEDPASVQASAAFAAADARVASTAAQLSGNVLDGADEVLQDIRGVFGGEEVATGSVSYETGLSNKELFFAGLSGAAGHFGVIIAGIIGVASFVAQIFESSIQAWTEDAVEGMIAGTALEGASPDAAASVVGGAFNTFAWEVALWAVLCVIALWAFSVVGSVVQYGGFRVRRRENRIEVEHGLLQRSFHGVDVDRVQTVVIKQSFVRCLIGYCELSVGKIDSLSTEDSNAQSSSVRGLVIHPFVKVSRVPEILDGVLPEFSHVPEETVRPAAVALRRAIVRRSVIRSVSFWLFVVAVAAYAGFVYTAASGMVVVDPGLFSIVQIAFFVYCGFFILMFALNVIDAVLWYKRSAMGCNRVFMSMTNGGLSVKTSIIPRKKIQYGFIRTNPFQRMAHVAIVNARTAAGVGGTTEALWDVSEEDAAAWIEWIRPRTESSVTER
ncbi:PH domain-containing protein [Slackia piriformis]|uniref:PH domain-containing protein n=1 Tax=Slackia piriformis TaxID=626934 RepID=UPI0023F4EAFA|nr:PH domain-containing protein [Slackia piriformis]